MGITVNTSPQQITASVGETKIDVSVSGGIGPTGPAGEVGGGYTLPVATASVLGGVKIGSGITIDGSGVISVSSASVAWDDITGKPSTFAPSAHAASHAEGGADQLFDQDLNTDDNVTFLGINVQNGGRLVNDQAGLYAVDVGSTGTASGGYITLSGANETTSIDQSVTVNAHGVTFADSSQQTTAYTGKVGTTSGLVLKTGTDGVIEALAQGTAGQVLKVNSGATGVEWGSAAADVSIDTTAADILSASSGSITADDPGADRLVFWDDSAGKLTHLEVGTGLSISGTTITAAAAVTVASPSQITANQNDYAGATADINRITSDAARDITGIAAGTDGQAFLLVNVGSFTITLKHQNASSTAANRIIVPWAGDCVIPADGSAALVYDNTTARWRVI